MDRPDPALLTALMAALPLPDTVGDGAPDWVQLIPAGTAVYTHDGRGPYRVEDAAALAAASMAQARIAGELPVDVEHATDRLAPKGIEAPARGWIREMQAREGGIWGRVEWTAEGRALVAGRAYRGISPVILHDAAGRILRILRAGLTNIPNLRGLAALNHEGTMDFQKQVAGKLGLAADAAPEAILAAIPAAGETAALQAQVAEIGKALGVEGAAPAAILAAARVRTAAGADTAALQAENAALKARVDGIEAAARKAASTAYIDRALQERRAGVRADNRDELIALHMEQPAVVEKLIGHQPKLAATHTGGMPPAAADGSVALSAEQLFVCDKLGIAPEAYLATLKSEQKEAR